MAIVEELRARPDTPSKRPPTIGRLLPAMVGTAAFIAFAAIQFVMERRVYSYRVRPPDASPAFFVVDWNTIRYVLAGDVSRFLALSITAMALLIHKRSRFFWLPAVAYTAGPLLLGWGDTDCQVTGRIPAAVGEGWRSLSAGCPSAIAAGWGPALLDLVLVLAPAITLAIVMRLRPLGPGRPSRSSSPAHPAIAFRVASWALVGFAVWATLWAWHLAGAMPTPLSAQLPKILPLLAFAVLLGTLSPRVAWTLPVVASLLATDSLRIPLLGFGARLSTSLWETFVSSLTSSWPFVLLPILVASRDALARGMEGLARSPMKALLVVNLLNLVDAGFTSFAVRSEGAVEVNPFVRLIGLPAKILLVGALSLMLFRVRPRALVWLVLPFLGVFAWHLAGSFATPS